MQPTQNIDPDRFVRRVGDFDGFRFQGLGFEWDRVLKLVVRAKGRYSAAL